jgi:hypothetical protein
MEPLIQLPAYSRVHPKLWTMVHRGLIDLVVKNHKAFVRLIDAIDFCPVEAQGQAGIYPLNKKARSPAGQN